MILYFSGVGNSRKVAECAGKMLGETVFPLTEVVGNKRDALVLQANEALGFVFPVYSWDRRPWCSARWRGCICLPFRHMCILSVPAGMIPERQPTYSERLSGTKGGSVMPAFL